MRTVAVGFHKQKDKLFDEKNEEETDAGNQLGQWVFDVPMKVFLHRFQMITANSIWFSFEKKINFSNILPSLRQQMQKTSG